MQRGAFLLSFWLLSLFVLNIALTGCNRSETKSINNQKSKVQRLLTDGNRLMKERRYNDAFDRYYNGFLLARQLNDGCALLQFNNQLGLVKYRQGKFTEAVPYIKEALIKRSFCADSDAYEPHGMLNTIALAYEQSNMADSAVAYYNKALVAIDKLHQNAKRAGAARGMIYGNLGGLYERENKYSLSEHFLKASIAINNRPGYDVNDAITAELKLAKLYLRTKRNKEADSVFIQAKEHLERQQALHDVNAMSVKDWYYLRWQYFDKNDMPLAAYSALKRFNQLKDSIEFTTKGLAYADMEKSFQVSKQHQQLVLFAKDNEIKKISIALIATLVVLVIIIAVLIALSLQRSKKHNTRLQETLDALERSQHFLQGLLNNLPIILYQIDPDGKITNSIGAGLDDVPDWSNDQLIGVNAFELAPDLTNAFRQAMGGKAARAVNAFAVNDDKFYFDTTVLPDQTTAGGIIGFAVDTTAVNRQAIRLTELNKFKDKILSVLSHDLRAPFSSIIMASEVLKLKSKHISGEELGMIMLGLRETASKSIGLLEGLLLWAQSERRNFVYHPQLVNLHNNIAEANGVYLYAQQRKNISLQNNIPTGLTLMAHHQMLLFVNRNLISNATKYSPDGGIISVSARADNKEVILTITDQGAGMTAEQINQLFKIKDKPVPDNHHGAGIALSICHDMILQMNGRIWAESIPGYGSMFCYALPVINQ
ncbi:hypothetical protein D0C36_18600 [Mucilaginibacter conchicola]|uniref:histidine kinase n=1 Tax=Mucilaginibacter conchicola TaxID=2303333 RepID=A0A372NQR8_9SPHI|nr:ATP-binding protein [Mucilaginibacter conchicola]RFZ90957.1 hypothetical protein D0C36_18600 [Mucilaginibacter conchicola]